MTRGPGPPVPPLVVALLQAIINDVKCLLRLGHNQEVYNLQKEHYFSVQLINTFRPNSLFIVNRVLVNLKLVFHPPKIC